MGDRSDGYVWECRKQSNGKWHSCERSIIEGSWFEKANLTIEKVLKFTYWWCQDLRVANKTATCFGHSC